MSMNTRTALVVYGTRNGCTRTCAVMVQEQIGSADVLDIMRARHVDLGGYDTIGLDIGAFGPLMRFLLARKAGVTAGYRRIKPEVIPSFAEAMRT